MKSHELTNFQPLNPHLMVLKAEFLVSLRQKQRAIAQEQCAGDGNEGERHGDSRWVYQPFIRKNGWFMRENRKIQSRYGGMNVD